MENTFAKETVSSFEATDLLDANDVASVQNAQAISFEDGPKEGFEHEEESDEMTDEDAIDDEESINDEDAITEEDEDEVNDESDED